MVAARDPAGSRLFLTRHSQALSSGTIFTDDDSATVHNLCEDIGMRYTPLRSCHESYWTRLCLWGVGDLKVQFFGVDLANLQFLV